jgi:uncharacterized membrane protein
MGAQVVTSILIGAVTGWLGMKALFPYAALFMLVAFVLMIFVKHGDAVKVKGGNVKSADLTSNKN